MKRSVVLLGLLVTVTALTWPPAAAPAELTRCGSLVQAPSIHGRWVEVDRITVVEGDPRCEEVRRVVSAYVGARGLHVAGSIEQWRVGAWTCHSGGSHAGCGARARGAEVQFLWKFPDRSADPRTCSGYGSHFEVSLVSCRSGSMVISALPRLSKRHPVEVMAAGRPWSCRAVRSTANDFLPALCAAGRSQISFDLDGPV